MTNREREILEIIKKQPDIEQSEIASRLNIARASVAVHISLSLIHISEPTRRS